MKNKFSILIPLFMILLSGCSNFSKDFQLTKIDEGKSETSIELNGMGGLQFAEGSYSNDVLSVRKYMYGNLTIYYRLLYQRNSFGNNMSPQRIILNIDRERYILAFLGSDKSDTSEWSWLIVEPPLLKKIAKANKILLTIEGTDKTIDYVFNKKYLYFYNRFYRECVLSKK